MNKEDYYNYCISCGFSEEEAKIKLKEKEIMLDLYFRNKIEPRDVTTTTYERLQKRRRKEVEIFIGFDRR